MLLLSESDLRALVVASGWRSRVPCTATLLLRQSLRAPAGFLRGGRQQHAVQPRASEIRAKARASVCTCAVVVLTHSARSIALSRPAPAAACACSVARRAPEPETRRMQWLKFESRERRHACPFPCAISRPRVQDPALRTECSGATPPLAAKTSRRYATRPYPAGPPARRCWIPLD